MILLAADAWRALLNRADRHHDACVRALKDIAEPLGSVWPVVDDVLRAFAGTPAGQDAVWEMIARGGVEMLALDESDVPRLRELMRRNTDRRIDMADAVVLHVAGREGMRTVFTMRGKQLGGYRSAGRRLKTIP